MLNHFITYLVVKTFYPIQVTYLRYQVDYINPKKTQLFGECRDAINYATLFVLIFGHREIKMISDANKITSVEVISEYTLRIINPRNEQS